MSNISRWLSRETERRALEKASRNKSRPKNLEATLSIYPMQVRKISMDHKGGTKSYFITVVTAANGKSLVIFRWGKKGSFGEIQTRQFDNVGQGSNFAEAKLKAKTAGGYATMNDHDGVAQNAAELGSLIGRAVYPKLAGDDINHLDAGIDTSSRAVRADPRFDEDGNFLGDAPPKGVPLPDPAIERKRLADIAAAAERAESQAVLRSHPNFGRF